MKDFRLHGNTIKVMICFLVFFSINKIDLFLRSAGRRTKVLKIVLKNIGMLITDVLIYLIQILKISRIYQRSLKAESLMMNHCHQF